MGAPRFVRARYRNTCRYCHQEFDAKFPGTTICYSEECQDQKVKDDHKRKQEKKRAANA